MMQAEDNLEYEINEKDEIIEEHITSITPDVVIEDEDVIKRSGNYEDLDDTVEVEPLSYLEEYDQEYGAMRAADSQMLNIPQLNNEVDSEKLGTWDGVFVPVILGVFGVITFLRTGWMVGQAGFLLALVIITTGLVVDSLTTFSLSAIASNGRLSTGGAYYMISRSLGPEFGGSIGVVYYLATCFASAVYLLGLVETFDFSFSEIGWQSTYWWNFAGETLALMILAGIAMGGAGLFAKAMIFIFVVEITSLVVMLLSFALMPAGSVEGYTSWSVETFRQNLGSHFTSDQDFMSVFAIFFPGMAGIMAGANMSGNLRDPGKNIANGTISGVSVVFVYYYVLAFCDRIYDPVRQTDSGLLCGHRHCVLESPHHWRHILCFSLCFSCRNSRWSEDAVGSFTISLSSDETPIDTANYEYCKGTECRIWDNEEILFASKDGGILITLFVKEIKERIVCNVHSKTCDGKIWSEIENNEYYIAGIEQKKLLINHVVRSPVFMDEMHAHVNLSKPNPYAGTVLNMNGVLLKRTADGSSKLVQRFPEGDSDNITLDALLSATNMGFEEKKQENINKIDRKIGTSLYIDLGYNNARCDRQLSCAFGVTSLSYRYRCYNQNFGYEEHEIIRLNETHRIKRERFGIHIKLAQTGKIARFSWPVLLTNIVSCFGMLSIVILLCDTIACCSSKYSSAKYEKISENEHKEKKE